MADEDLQDKTEQATPKRLEDARLEGQLPRSRELNGLIMLLAGSSGLLAFAGSWASHWQQLIQEIWRAEVVLNINATDGPSWLTALLIDALWQLAPWLMLMYVVAFCAPLLLSGWSFSTKALGFKFDRMSPLKGLKRMFGVQGLVELLKALAKFALVATIAVAVFTALQPQVMALGNESSRSGIAHGSWLVGVTFLAVSCALILVAAIDVPYQIWQHNKNMRMSRQQVKDENKQTEGDPQLKARVRQVQREMARSRMMAAVPTADVIITNPEHYAVAFRYDPLRMVAPELIAKGMGHTAAKIREIAATANVPLVRSPLLARTTYYSTEIGEGIPVELYVAVAQILAHLNEISTTAAAAAISADQAVPPEYAEAILGKRGKL